MNEWRRPEDDSEPGSPFYDEAPLGLIETEYCDSTVWIADEATDWHFNPAGILSDEVIELIARGEAVICWRDFASWQQFYRKTGHYGEVRVWEVALSFALMICKKYDRDLLLVLDGNGHDVERIAGCGHTHTSET